MGPDRSVAHGGLARDRFHDVAGTPTLAAAVTLAGLMLGAAVVWLTLGRRIATPWIMIDELIYSEMAKSFADGAEFRTRDIATTYTSVYPALIAPAWFASSMETTYDLAKTINTALMTLTAIPVYLWARRLTSPALALLPAGLTLAMPAFLYTGTLMTENAFLPAFVLAAFALALALERPTLLRQGFALATAALATGVRLQALVLVLVIPLAVLLKLLFDMLARDAPRAGVLRELARFAPTLAVLGFGSAGYVVWKLTSGERLISGLGAYRAVGEVDYSLDDTARWTRDHLAELSLSVGVAPVCALIVLTALALRGRPALSVSERAFLAVALATIPLLTVQVAMFASRFILRIEERNLFVVAPLLFLALTVWLARGLPRPPIATAVAALVPLPLLLALPLADLLNVSIFSDTLSLIPLLRLSQEIDLDAVRGLMVAGAAGAGLTFALAPRVLAAPLIPAGIAVFLLATTYSASGAIRDFSEGELALTGQGDPTWVDEALGGGEAAYLSGVAEDQFTEAKVLWQTEFWNRSVDGVYRLAGSEPSSFVLTPVSADPATGELLRGDGGRIRGVRHVVAYQTAKLIGDVVVNRPPLSLFRIRPPLRLASRVEGVYGDGWTGAHAALTQYATPESRRGRLHIILSREAWRGPDVPGRVTLRLGPFERSGEVQTRTWVAHSGSRRTFVLRTPQAPFRLALTVEPTFSPSRFALPDTRELGVQVHFRFRADPR